MKTSLTIIFTLLIAILVLAVACKAKKEMDDPTVLEIHILAELEKGVPAKRVQTDLKQFEIKKIKPTNKTLNQYLFQVFLKGQSADELLRAFRTKEYVKSAVLAPMGDKPAENMPSGKSSKSKPIKG